MSIGFALIEDNIVIDIVAVDDAQAHRGQEFLADDLGLGGTWIQMGPEPSQNACIGGTYDPKKKVFIPPQPDDETFIFDEEKWAWLPTEPLD